MDAPILWLFLFIALVIGWMFGRYETKRQLSRKKTDLNASSVKTRLQLLFDNYSDSAIDNMLQSLEVTPETFTTHVSIGKHFRKQGEVEKAILVHQNLMAHPELSEKNSDVVIFELAKDYKVAGLFDRSVSLLEQLLNSKTFQYDAHLLMLDIREKEHDWESAYSHAQKIDLKKYPEIRLKLSYYLCELAEEKLSESLVRESEVFYKQALSVFKQCVRAIIGLAEISIIRQDYAQAIRYLKQVPDLSPEDISLSFPLLLRCTIETNSFNQYCAYLDSLYEKTGQVSVVMAKADALMAEKDADTAINYIKECIKLSPKLGLFNYLIRLIRDNKLKPESHTDELQAEVVELVDHLSEGLSRFKCNQCGFATSAHLWQCPSCKGWQTVKPELEYTKR